MKDNIVTVEHLSFTYKDSEGPAVKDASFLIPKGTWTTLVGHNGSGKSTIAHLLNGVLLSDDNPNTLINIDGITLTEKTMWGIRNRVRIVFQNPDDQFVGTMVKDDIVFGLENRRVSRIKMKSIVRDVLNQVEMMTSQESEPQYLSGGQKQGVAIAGILAIGPRLIILDESTDMFNPAGKSKILRLIKKLQKENELAIFSIVHDVNEVMHADQILVLNKGGLLAGDSPGDISKDGSLIRSVGLDLPLFYKIKNKLINEGISILREVNTEEKLVNYLC